MEFQSRSEACCSIVGCSRSRVLGLISYQVLDSLVTTMALPAIDLVPSITSQTNAAASIHKPAKRKRNRIMARLWPVWLKWARNQTQHARRTSKLNHPARGADPASPHEATQGRGRATLAQAGRTRTPRIDRDRKPRRSPCQGWLRARLP